MQHARLADATPCTACEWGKRPTPDLLVPLTPGLQTCPAVPVPHHLGLLRTSQQRPEHVPNQLRDSLHKNMLQAIRTHSPWTYAG